MPKPLIDVVRIGKRGELLLPRRVRSSLGLKEGDELILTADDRRIVLERRARAFRAYLDVMAGEREDPPGPPAEPASRGRRGLGRFLTR